MEDGKLTMEQARDKIDRGELTTDEALDLLAKGQIMSVKAGAKPKTESTGKPEQKKPEPKADAKPESGSESKLGPKKRAASSGKSRTIADMEEERDAVWAKAKRLTAEIEKRKREEKRKAEKAKREQEQRDALDWYRKYRDHIEMAKRLKLQSGMTVFEYLESEVAKANVREKGNQKA